MKFVYMFQVHAKGCLAALFAALLLSACGGGDQVSADAPQSVKAFAALATPQPSISVVSLTKVSETRISRTVYDYVFKVTFQNGNLDQTGVTANLTATGPGTTVLDGSVTVGDMVANAVSTPADTITLRQDRTYTFDQTAIKWNIMSIASGGSLADANLTSVSFGASSDGNVYGIAGTDFNKLIALNITGGSPGDQYSLSLSCGLPRVSVAQVNSEWRLMVKGIDFPIGSQFDICLRVVNLTTNKFVMLAFKMIALTPTNTGRVSIPPQGSGTFTTSNGYAIQFNGNNLGSNIIASFFEAPGPDGDRIFTITFNTDVTNAGMKVQLPDWNAPPALKATAAALRRMTAAPTTQTSTPLPATLPDPYPANRQNLGYKWNKVLGSGAISASLDNSLMRIPDKLAPDVSWLLDTAIPASSDSSTPAYPSTITSHQTEVSALYSILEQQSWDIGDAEVVIFVNGFQIEPHVNGTNFLELQGGGQDTWGEFPRLAKNSALFGGKRLIPFEFRWATNARFSDVADDLAKSIKLIENNLNLNGTTKRINIVAHSFGGLLVKTLLANRQTSSELSTAKNLVKSVMTLGTPHSGVKPYSNPISYLPKGTDFDLIINCKQASCYEAGIEGTILSPSINVSQKKILYGDSQQVMDDKSTAVEVYAGYLPTILSKLPLLPIDFYVGIGLRGDSKIGDAGDKLISFDGQRFAPTYVGQDLRGDFLGNPTPILGVYTETLAGGVRVHERILGTSYRPLGGALSKLIFDSPRSNGYAHQANLPVLIGVTDGSSIQGWGLEANISEGCEVGSDLICPHASLRLLRDLLMAPVPVVDSASPTTLVGNNTSQSLVISGSNFLTMSMVQYKGAIATSNSWMIVPLHGAGPIVSPTQISLTVLPQVGETSLDFRVCRQTPVGDADCSSGTQTVAVTAPIVCTYPNALINGICVMPTTSTIPLTVSSWRLWIFNVPPFYAPPGIGVFEETAEGLKFYESVWRGGAIIFTNSDYPFAGKTLYAKLKFNGGATFGDAGIGISFSCTTEPCGYERLVNLSTGNSYNGSTRISDNTWYFVRSAINSSGFISVTATGNYDDQGGTIVQTYSRTFSAYSNRGKPTIYFGDTSAPTVTTVLGELIIK
jgi:hypothetical protein